MLAKMFLHGRHCYVAVTVMTELHTPSMNNGHKEYLVSLANGMQEKIVMDAATQAGMEKGCLRLG
ncbi:hypothetical protein [Tatumella saanichensis]|uniref:hypothetical protein n=1 Tax=Tatumella saanichensis TaxID=480813 RepID=UPI0004A4CD5C|nr:hypothetical protein [Tatumella saanichensis]